MPARGGSRFVWGPRSPGALNDDRERDVELTLAGYRVLRFTYEQVTERPEYVIQAILAALGAL